MRLTPKPAYTLFLKTGTFCNAGCVSCPAGRKRPEDRERSSMMTADMLERILDRVEVFGRVISATHHYYNEPTLNPHIAELVAACHRRGVHCLMSTNGSYPDKLRPVLEQGLTNLIFSVSGWTQAVHERSHRNVRIDTVREAMRMAAGVVASRRDFRGGRMFVRVSWHDYEYNRHERDYMRQFSEDLGFKFTSYNTGLLPLEQAQERMVQSVLDPDSPEHPGERDLRTKLKEAATLCRERRHWPCINQQRMITVDGDGVLHNCCVKAHDANKRGSIFETDLEEFDRYRREEDPDCRACLAAGHHVYAMQQYRLPLGPWTTAKKRGEALWRRFNLGGVFPQLSAWRSQWTYDRPQKEVER